MKRSALAAVAAALSIAAGSAVAQSYERPLIPIDPSNPREAYRAAETYVAPQDYMDEATACQETVRNEILARNRGRVDVDFRARVRKEDWGRNERIRGSGIVSRRDDSARFAYECVVDDRRNRVITATYEVRGDNSFR